MSEADIAACRQLLQGHIQSLPGSRPGSSDGAVDESECTQLLTQLQVLRSRNGNEAWMLQLSIDTALRDELFHLISTLSITDPGFVQVWFLLDTATILADKDLSEIPSNFLLIESLLDSQTVSGCRKVFDYLESRRDRLIAHNFQKKSLVILRCCNELLRRLSRAEDAVFCGRVFIFLFQSFPLGDRSSVNLRGEFHVENVTLFDPAPKKSEHAIKPMEIDGDRPASSGGQTPASTVPDTDAQRTGRSTPIPGRIKQEQKPVEAPPDLDALFPQFWSLQVLFSTPTRLFEPSEMTRFKESMSATLACFKSMSSSSGSSSSTQPSNRGTKRKRSSDGIRAAQPYNPKYLTNRDLFDLEVHDTAFRRHILAQCLIMLDFLLYLVPAAKVNVDKLSNKAVLHSFALSEEDSKFYHSMRQSIATYLQQQGPGNDGKMYHRMIDTVLSRDKNWVRWKAEGCPSIKRAPVEGATILSAKKVLTGLAEKRPFANPPGAADFNFLSQAKSLDALKRPSERHKVPSAEQYYNAIEGDKLDEEMAFNEDERKAIKEKIQGRLWRALRASSLEGRRFSLCEKIKDGANLKALIGQDEEAAAETTDVSAKEAAESGAPRTNGEDQGEENTPAETETDPTSVTQVDASGEVPDAEEVIPTDDAEEQTPNKGEPEEGEDAAVTPSGVMDVDGGEGRVVEAEIEHVSTPTEGGSQAETTEAVAEGAKEE